ncbi:MAG: 50S ribosomal protein L29 [bacterium]|nr:50S ribosomal protein L29 [bacterium]MDT8364962.1 50S ribosomal protein L29 [bacterium]
MKPSELRDLTLEELRQKESDLNSELFNLRFQLATNQLENPMRLPLTKKDLARVKTVIAQKEQSAERTE